MATGAEEGEQWWDQEASGSEVMSPTDMSNVHAVNASTAAYHADVAAKHAASLAQWVQYLSGTLGVLQMKVTELEDWKRRALEETRKLREEHKALKQQVLEGIALGSEDVSPEDGLGGIIPGRPCNHLEEDGLRLTPISSSATFELDDASPTDRETPSIRKTGDSPLLAKTPKSTSTTPTPGPSDTSRSAGPLSPGPVSPTSSPSARFGDLDASKEEGLKVSSEVMDGVERWRAEWRIGNLSAKLRGCMGRALVSSSFEALGLEDLRLMISPDGKEAAQGPRNRKHKELYTKKITEGPLDACLKLKVPNCPAACELEFSLTVGHLQRGPFRHNFMESTVSECGDFGDWLLQLETDKSLTVAVELQRVAGKLQEKGDAVATASNDHEGASPVLL